MLLNDRQDFFGQTVNIASRVQGAANSTAIVVTGPIVQDQLAAGLLERSGLQPLPRAAMLSGLAHQVTLYEIP